jgi:single stranded DNA-binding protein
MFHKVTNQVTLIGNLGADPEFFGNEERPGARFDLATNDTYGNGENRKTRTDWHTVVCWGGLVRSCEALGKGDQVAVSGTLRSRMREIEDIKVRVTEIHATGIEFLRLKNRDGRD